MSLLREMFYDLVKHTGGDVDELQRQERTGNKNPGSLVNMRHRIERQKAMVEYITENPGVIAHDVAQFMGLEDSTVRKHLRRMRADNILFTDGAVGQAPKYFVRKNDA